MNARFWVTTTVATSAGNSQLHSTVSSTSNVLERSLSTTMIDTVADSSMKHREYTGSATEVELETENWNHWKLPINEQFITQHEINRILNNL